MTTGILAMIVPSWMQLLIIAGLVLVLFGGKGKISAIMGDFAKGITSFRKGLKEDEDQQRAAAAAASLSDTRETVDAAPERKADGARTES